MALGEQSYLAEVERSPLGKAILKRKRRPHREMSYSRFSHRDNDIDAGKVILDIMDDRDCLTGCQ